MGVLLGLRDVELAPAGRSDRAGEARHHLRRERDLDGQARLVFGHRDHEQVAGRGPAGRAGPVKRAERGIRERVHQLPCSIGPEVGVDDRLAIRERAADALDDRGRHELVADAARIRGLNGGGR